MSARFRGNPVFESIAAGNTTSYLHYGIQSNEVGEVQLALIDRGYAIPDGATGFFGNQTSAAVVQFKIDQNLTPNDPVVGKGTLGALDDYFSLPFADHYEWASWQQRPLQDWNYSRRRELVRRAMGTPFTFNPAGPALPQAIRDGIAAGLSELLDPKGSPNGQYTPAATWGASPLDLFHLHVCVDLGGMDPSWSQIHVQGEKLHARILTMMAKADQSGQEGTSAWTAAYRNLLLEPAPLGGQSFNEATSDVLQSAVANSVAVNQPLELVWHTFETKKWRPSGMSSDDARRSWWSAVLPALTPVTSTPFAAGPEFGNNVYQLLELGFVVDYNGVVTVMGTTLVEAAAVVGLDKAQIVSAWTD
jgi:hypothetical protein